MGGSGPDVCSPQRGALRSAGRKKNKKNNLKPSTNNDVRTEKHEEDLHHAESVPEKDATNESLSGKEKVWRVSLMKTGVISVLVRCTCSVGVRQSDSTAVRPFSTVCQPSSRQRTAFVSCLTPDQYPLILAHFNSKTHLSVGFPCCLYLLLHFFLNVLFINWIKTPRVAQEQGTSCFLFPSVCIIFFFLNCA